MAVKAFRTFANGLREPAPYFPVVTECRGAANIVIGSMQLLVSRCMKLSSNSTYNGSIADRHVVIGAAALKQGFKELLPGIVVGVGVVLAARNWSYPPSDL